MMSTWMSWRWSWVASSPAVQMGLDDEYLDQLTVRAALGRRLRDMRLRERLEAAIAARFPQRAAGRDLGAALVAAPLPGERTHCEVTDSAVRSQCYFLQQE